MGRERRKKRKLIVIASILMALLVVGIGFKLSVKNIDDGETPLAGNVPVAITQLLKNPASINSLEKCDFKFNSWISGDYTGSKGTYVAKATDLCLAEYKSVNSTSYQVKMTDTYFFMTIAEFDQNGKYLSNNFAVNGMTYKPKSNVKYVGIGIYNYKPNRTMTYAKYKELFDKGLEIKLISNDPVKVEEPEKEEVKEEPEAEIVEEVLIPQINSSAAPAPEPVVKTPAELCREEMKQMILTGDMTTHKITDYKIYWRDALEIWDDLKKTDCYMYSGMDALFLSPGWDKENNLTTMSIYGMDEDFLNRHDRMMKVIDELCAQVDDKMSDLDKIIFVHEYLVKNTTYSKTCYHPGSPSSVLGNKTGMCAGFAQSMNILLEKMGVDTYTVGSSKMNHEWNYVKVDGELYHIDNCWDNTKQTKSTGQYWHRYLLRNDSEMNKISPTHYSFVCDDDKSYTSTSTKFSNWFVHDVYGEMFYNNGLWYYYDKPTNSIKSSDAYGKTQTTIITGGSSTLKLTKLEKGVISYTLGGVNKTYTIK